jgi:FkbM family methyltransferase
MIKDRIIKYLKKLTIMIENPLSIKAGFSGCQVDTFDLLSKIKSMNFSPKTIIDIGANRGMFSRTAHYLFKDAKIIAYEPLKDCFTALKRLSISNFEYYNYALGNKIEKNQIFKSAYDESSSILKMADLHKEAFPTENKIETETIEVTTLDNALQNRYLEKPILVKIDVQGYEKFVIDGAAEILENTDILICEISFYKLYDNQALFDEIYSQLKKLSFEFFGSLEDLVHPKKSTVLQMDALFIKNNIKLAPN